MLTHSKDSRPLPRVVVYFRHSGRLKRRHLAEQTLIRYEVWAPLDLFIKLSPEDGDDGMELHGSDLSSVLSTPRERL